MRKTEPRFGPWLCWTWRNAGQNLALALLYSALSWLGLALQGPDFVVALIWPASGLALAAVLLGGPRMWLGIALGELLVGILFHAPWPVTLCWIVGDTLEALAAAYLLRRVGRLGLSLRRIRDVLALVVFGSLLSTVLSASFGTFTLWAFLARPSHELPYLWGLWWIANGMGILLVTPVVLTWATRPWPDWEWPRLAEILGLGTGVALATLLAFRLGTSELVSWALLMYGLGPLLVGIALRFGPREAAGAILLMAGLAVWGTATGGGPFVAASSSEALRNLWAYVSTVSVTVLLLSAAQQERQRAETSYRLRMRAPQRVRRRVPANTPWPDAPRGSALPVPQITAPLILVFLTTTLLLVFYETSKDFLFPTASSWESHEVSILTGAGLATFVSFFLFRYQHGLQLRILKETVQRKRLEDVKTRLGEHTLALERTTRDLQNQMQERLRAERALRESEERFRTLAESVRLIPWEADAATERFVYVGPQAVAILGYPLEDWLRPLFWVEAMHPEDQTWAPQFCSRMMHGHEHYEFEYRMLAADGRSVWLQDIVNVVRHDDGTPKILRGFLIDITARKETEQALRESEHRLERAERFSSIMIAHCAPDGRWLKVAPALCTLLGYTNDELLAIPGPDLTHPDDRAQDEQLRLKLLAGEIPAYDREQRYLRCDGTSVWVHINCSSVHDAQGHVSYFLTYLQDISARKQADEVLRRERDLLDGILRTSVAAITMVDRSGRIMFANDSAELVLGLRQDEISQRQYNAPEWKITGLHGEPFPEELLPFNQVLRTGQPVFDVRHAIEWPDGNRKLLSINGAPLRDAAGEISTAVFLVTDITARQRAEEELRFRLAFEDLVSSISTQFINLQPEEIDAGILRSLEQLGQFAESDRSYIFLLDEDGKTVYNSHEWCAPGIASIQEQWQRIDLEAKLPWFAAHLQRLESIYVPSLVALPPEAARERAHWQAQQIHTLVAVPMILRGSLRGFLGFEAVARPATWDDDLIALLKITGEIFEQALERKRTEQALRDREERFRKYFELGLMGQAMTSPEKGWLEVNDELCRILGYTREELVRTTWLQLTYPEDIDKDVTQFQRVLAREIDGYSLEKRFIRKDGDMIYVDLAVNCVRRPNGEVDYFIALVQDISTRRETELSLRESEQRFRNLADASPVLLWMSDDQGGVTFVNQPFVRFTGMPSETLLARGWVEHVHENEVARTVETYLDAVARQVPFQLEARLRRVDHTYRWLFAQGVPRFHEDGTFQGMIGCCLDITDRLQAEQERLTARQELLEIQLREKERVEAELAKVRTELVRQTRLAAIGQMSAQIAHDLRNPLGSIRNAVYLIRRKVPATEPKWREYLEIMQQEITACDRIIGHLLDFTRGRDPDLKLVLINELVGEALRRCESPPQVHLEFYPLSGDSLWEVDPVQFRQVLDNLLKNAVEAAGETGTIALRLSEGDNARTLEIANSGAQVRPEHRDQIFDPFFTTKAKGTGLGLAICRQILERHGGTIELAEPPDGGGTAFRLRLPKQPRTERQPRSE